MITHVWEERLHVGGLGNAGEIAKSNSFGITTVITLCREPVLQRRQGINYLTVPVVEARPMPSRWLEPIIDVLWENIRWGAVELMSHTGTSRAPVIAAAWMHTVGCEDIDAALKDIGRLRTIEPSPILLWSASRALK